MDPFSLFAFSVAAAIGGVIGNRAERWAGGNPHGEPPERLRRWLELEYSRLIRLDLMNESEIAEWLRQWGSGELRSFADDPSFVWDLHETTDGLPLYLRYLLDDLGRRQGRAGMFGQSWSKRRKILRSMCNSNLTVCWNWTCQSKFGDSLRC